MQGPWGVGQVAHQWEQSIQISHHFIIHVVKLLRTIDEVLCGTLSVFVQLLLSF